MNNRFLNAGYMVEVINGRLNGSSEQVENKRTGFDNVTYVKKIGRNATVSAPCQKFAIKNYINNNGYELSKRMKNGKKITISAMPHKYIDEDVFGFMRADKEEITKEQYDQLSEVEQNTFSKSKNKYTRNITKKRKSRFLMSHLTNVSNRAINLEWNVASTEGDSLPYNVETSSGIFAGIANIDINKIAEFNISDIESEFRDYAKEEVENEDDIRLNIEEKVKRIEMVLKGFEYLSIQGNQNNYLTDTAPKFIILGEYSWGNNVFQGIIKRDGIDIEALKETLEENEEFRLSDIWIGVSRRITDSNYENVKQDLEKAFEDDDCIHVSTVKRAFDSYFKHMYKSFGLDYDNKKNKEEK